jgi:hypothetical protein
MGDGLGAARRTFSSASRSRRAPDQGIGVFAGRDRGDHRPRAGRAFFAHPRYWIRHAARGARHKIKVL